MNIVAYCRLSRDDGDDESSSITNQKRILNEYAVAHKMNIRAFYIDDGYSGYTMDRPDFNKLKQDLNDDRVDVIIVKDLSRLGRHNAKVQLFLENIIEQNKRVIAIGDNYDSANENSHDMVGIQTWFNEKYVRDVSKKIRKTIETMQKEGRFISCVPYGYYIDPLKKGVYHVDPTCAMYVQEMFEMYLDGFGINKIATNFTHRNIPTGTMITKQRLERLGKHYRGKVTTQWNPSVIMSMLKNNFYIGTLTLGKTKKRSINGKQIKQNEEDHYIFENAHEPIIDRKTFQLVQEAILQRNHDKYRGKRVEGRENAFAGVLYCADCGTKLTTSGNKVNTRYVCRTYNIYGTRLCTSHSVTERELKEVLIYFLEHCLKNLTLVIEDLDNIIHESAKHINENVIDILEKDIKNTEYEVKILLEQKMREIRSNPTMAETIDDVYKQLLNEKYTQIKSLKTQLEDHRKEVLHDDHIYNNLNSAADIIKDIIQHGNITRRQVATIVDKIIVHEDGGLDIQLKGNLHELCSNYVQTKLTDRGRMLKATAEYINSTPDCVMSTAAYKYVKNKGHKTGYEKFFKIFSTFVKDGYLAPNAGYNSGYHLARPIDHDFYNNIIGQFTSRVTNNNVDMRIIKNICRWAEQMKFKKTVF